MQIFYILAVMLLVSINCYGSEADTAKIALAQSAAHSGISKNATIIDMDGRVLKTGQFI